MPGLGADPRLLRAVAHPVRNRILLELEAGGPLRAADLAERLGVPANQASFHLRQLAKYGAIQEAPELARDRRDRVWRLVNEGDFSFELDSLAQAPGGQAAVSAWARHSAARAHELVDSVYALRREPGRTSAIIESSVRLTREEAKALVAEIDAVIEQWAARTRGVDDGQQRLTYQLLALLESYPDLSPGPERE